MQSALGILYREQDLTSWWRPVMLNLGLDLGLGLGLRPEICGLGLGLGLET